MRRTLDVRTGASEALLAEARDERVEQIVERELLRDGVAQIGQRQAQTLRVVDDAHRQ